MNDFGTKPTHSLTHAEDVLNAVVAGADVPLLALLEASTAMSQNDALSPAARTEARRALQHALVTALELRHAILGVPEIVRHAVGTADMSILRTAHGSGRGTGVCREARSEPPQPFRAMWGSPSETAPPQPERVDGASGDLPPNPLLKTAEFLQDASRGVDIPEQLQRAEALTKSVDLPDPPKQESVAPDTSDRIVPRRFQGA